MPVAGKHAHLLLTILLVTLIPATFSQVRATASESIPIIGRYSSLTIGIQIPRTPTWAHDVVLNASIAWNEAQLWYQQTGPVTGSTYTFVESGQASAVISFSMPAAYSGFAVGWTNYNYVPSSKNILSTQTFLDPYVFNSSQENNVTARQYALRLALHELGRILGLGSVLDGRDIMDPRNTPERVNEAPLLSSLDLYATQVLAEGNLPNSVTLPSNVQNQAVDARMFLGGGSSAPIPTPEFDGNFSTIVILCSIGALFFLRRRKHN